MQGTRAVIEMRTGDIREFMYPVKMLGVRNGVVRFLVLKQPDKVAKKPNPR